GGRGPGTAPASALLMLSAARVRLLAPASAVTATNWKRTFRCVLFIAYACDVIGVVSGTVAEPWAEGQSAACNSRYACAIPCAFRARAPTRHRSEEHTSELQSRENLVCRLLLEKKKQYKTKQPHQMKRPND